jgi:hypothetical protein
VPRVAYQHPASIYNSIRHHVYSIFERTQDIDRALTAVSMCASQPDMFRKFYAGLRGELLVYTSKQSKKLKLEPLLDAGIKADFAGIRSGKPINIDVTTNLDYKDIDEYAEQSVKRNKLYEIAAVSLRTEEIEFFPLRFPLCSECDKFSHYILVLAEPGSGIYFWASEDQTIYQYCTKCETNAQVDSYSYRVPSPLFSLKDQLMDWQEGDKSINEQEFLNQEAIPIAKFFEKTSGRMLSAVADTQYEIINPRDGDGDWFKKTVWKHPLARDIGVELDF